MLGTTWLAAAAIVLVVVVVVVVVVFVALLVTANVEAAFGWTTASVCGCW